MRKFRNLTYPEDDIADIEVSLQLIYLLPELFGHVRHVGPLARFAEELEEAELGGPQEAGEADPVALVEAPAHGGHRAPPTRHVQGAGQPVQLVPVQREVGLHGHEAPPRLLRGLRVQVELAAEVPVLGLHIVHGDVGPRARHPGRGLRNFLLLTGWHGDT